MCVLYAVVSMNDNTVLCSSISGSSDFSGPTLNDKNIVLWVNVENWLLKHNAYSPDSFKYVNKMKFDQIEIVSVKKSCKKV